MQSLSLLNPFLGVEKTLVITCHECVQLPEQEEHVFTYQCLGNMLRKADHRQLECIRYYLDVKKCSQVIVAGHYDCHVIERILSHPPEKTSPVRLQYNLDVLRTVHAHSLQQPAVKNRMLIELNVIEQLKLLMDYDFIYDKVNSNIVKLRGVVFDYEVNTAREIFRNGITFNNLIVLN